MDNNNSAEKVLGYFKKISSIPRGSGNEGEICEYIENFAKERNLSVYRDEHFNLIIKKPASADCGNDAKPVIIQGHLDMVCEKNADTEFDFKTQPLKLITEGDFIRASGTTLGADNGIALAYAMELMDGNYTHPPLEIVLTADEETGMTGALLLDTSSLSGKRLINIDEETEGNFVVSCAGGVKSLVRLPLIFEETPPELTEVTVSIKGLKGGHSGFAIKKQRANANILMGRVLNHLLGKIDFRLASLNGGLKDNAIPREAVAVLYVSPADFDKLAVLTREIAQIIKHEYEYEDPDISVEAAVSKEEASGKAISNAASSEKNASSNAQTVTAECLGRVISLLTVIPNGVYFYDDETAKSVQTSTNAGVMRTEGGELTIQNAVRSSVLSRKQLLHEKIKNLAKLSGGYENSFSDYPEWERAASSKIRDTFTSVYARMYGKKPEVSGVHAGLECGVFSKKIGSTDMIAFGPDIFGAHTPDEKMSLSSAKRMWEFLLAVLAELANLDT
ncbi:MAG: aminoacyl-histidine dipeptidase [Clostridiales bacterium]|jgi:dipeptidase D|nr:aminoacyl-histidine dipeptidase [Clostridiales bacterium]